jgi:hypothetical protein
VIILGRKEKLIERLKSNPKDFSFDEMKVALESFGFVMSNKGKTSGSRIRFMKGNIAISLHKPHPRKELLEYQIKQVLEILEKEGLL